MKISTRSHTFSLIDEYPEVSNIAEDNLADVQSGEVPSNPIATDGSRAVWGRSSFTDSDPEGFTAIDSLVADGSIIKSSYIGAIDSQEGFQDLNSEGNGGSNISSGVTIEGSVVIESDISGNTKVKNFSVLGSKVSGNFDISNESPSPGGRQKFPTGQHSSIRPPSSQIKNSKLFGPGQVTGNSSISESEVTGGSVHNSQVISSTLKDFALLNSEVTRSKVDYSGIVDSTVKNNSDISNSSQIRDNSTIDSSKISSGIIKSSKVEESSVESSIVVNQSNLFESEIKNVSLLSNTNVFGSVINSVNPHATIKNSIIINSQINLRDSIEGKLIVNNKIYDLSKLDEFKDFPNFNFSNNSFLNGEKPKVAIYDEFPENVQRGGISHGDTVREVIESQLGPLGKNVDIDFYDILSLGPFSHSIGLGDLAESILKSGKKYDYINVSYGDDYFTRKKRGAEEELYPLGGSKLGKIFNPHTALAIGSDSERRDLLSKYLRYADSTPEQLVQDMVVNGVLPKDLSSQDREREMAAASQVIKEAIELQKVKKLLDFGTTIVLAHPNNTQRQNPERARTINLLRYADSRGKFITAAALANTSEFDTISHDKNHTAEDAFKNFKIQNVKNDQLASTVDFFSAGRVQNFVSPKYPFGSIYGNSFAAPDVIVNMIYEAAGVKSSDLLPYIIAAEQRRAGFGLADTGSYPYHVIRKFDDDDNGVIHDDRVIFPTARSVKASPK
jgi:hypothetical protein